MAEHLIEARLKFGRDRRVQPPRLHISRRPRHADDTRQQPLQERVSAEDGIGGALARGGELPEPRMSAARRDQSIVGESAEHFRSRLLADLEVLGDE